MRSPFEAGTGSGAGRGRSGLIGRTLGIPPPLFLLLIYAALVAAGGALLKLPAATTAAISWSDALFTATSAVTVTGLVVIDTGSTLTLFGQSVVALLIQLGGLGLMTFATLVFASLGLPIGLGHRDYLREDLGQTSVAEVLSLALVIGRLVLLFELIGAAVLAGVFVPDLGWRDGLWSATFHTISAFNNAGFALYPDSLTRWSTDPVVNLVVPALFIIGGLGFGVLRDLSLRRAWAPLTLHSKLMLSGTAGLLLGAFVLIAVIEWSNPATLGQYAEAGDRLWVAWFQAATPRTAGFNTADYAGMHDSTTLLTMTLMAIGGGSTSTAGGIKVTTFVVLLLATYAFFRRRAAMTAFGRSIGFSDALKVMALVTISMMIILASSFVITLSHDGEFVDLLFEVVSAFGTVGLSRGATGELDPLGRIVIMGLMFVGRVGPLTLGFFLATTTPSNIRYPQSHVYLG
ncbi:MAG: TrkH family potassium uptake protein [Pseudomonadota bacterium]|nr:TrkH family potassium uptake protein [Pseudomonadota bacterium]